MAQEPITTSEPTTYVFLPGFMCDHALWSKVQPRVCPGELAHFADLSKDSSISAMAERTLAATHGALILIGFSMGGFVAQEIVHQAPKRVRALALINTSSRASSQKEIERNQGLVDLTRANGFKGLAPGTIRRALHPDLSESSRLPKTIASMATRLGADGFINQLQAVREDGFARLKNVACPSLVVWSRQDALRSLAEAEALRNALTDTPHTPAFEIIEDCGHMTPLEKPLELAAIIGYWLTKVDYSLA